jgi:hypothetical protein
MSYTIYKSTSGLIAQPGRTVSTFPSGLVRVEQSYLGLTANAAANRAALAVGNNMPDGDSSPCIDGLKIFPEVQEVRREDGFTDYKVSAYGRVNTGGTGELNAEIVSVARNYRRILNEGTVNETTAAWSVAETYIVDSYLKRFTVLKSTDNSEIPIPSENLTRRRLTLRITGTTPGPISGNSLIWDQTISSVTRRDFGFFDEIAISYQLIPQDDPNSFTFADLV